MADAAPLELTVADLAASLRQLGLSQGDSVLLHSAYRQVRPMENGPAGVIDAILAVIGPAGNLMLPTFNYSRPLPSPYFDPKTTPGRTGIIPELGRQRPGAVRSLHPTHSVAVIGLDAERLCRDHLTVRAMGVGSPIDRLAESGGKVLLLGVGHTSNSTIHVGEEHAGIPKGSWFAELPEAKILSPQGPIIHHRLDTSPSCSIAFGGVEGRLRERGAIRDGRVRNCFLQLMTGREVIAATVELLRQKPDLLLCTDPQCRPCSASRQMRGQ
jgi:aminoglycoside 3-N-acetyltransferase